MCTILQLPIHFLVDCAEYEAAKYLMLDVLHDITEINKCQDCYRHSSVKDDELWFIKPCRPPHELVYAKQTGYSYWPAKVIRKMGTTYDVRFFGYQHSRAVIPARNIKPLNEKPPSLKRSAKLIEALDEMSKHQDMLSGSHTSQDPVRAAVGRPKKTARAPKNKPVKEKTSTKKSTKSVSRSRTSSAKKVPPSPSDVIENLDDVFEPSIESVSPPPKKVRDCESPVMIGSDNESASSTISDYLGREVVDKYDHHHNLSFQFNKFNVDLHRIYDARPVLHRLDESLYRHNLTQHSFNGEFSPPSLVPDDVQSAIDKVRFPV